jgi:hypothetical protein
MPTLYDRSNNRRLGRISQQDLQLLIVHMEGSIGGDRDPCVDNDAFLRLTEAGASAALLDAVKMALDLSGEAHIRWDAD